MGGIKNLGIVTRVASVWRLLSETFAQISRFAEWKPAAVFSMGGYVAGPPVMAALLSRTPVVVMEPNAHPGFTNRVISRFVSRALVSFSETARYFPRSEQTGLPVVTEVMSPSDMPAVEEYADVLQIGARNMQNFPLLKAAVKDEVPEVGFCAAQGLWQLGDPTGRAVLLSVVQGQTKASSGYVSKQKREALRMFKTPVTLIGTLVKFGVGFAPVPGLGTGLSSLRGLMKNGEVAPRALALLDLSQDRHPDTLQVLREALNDKDWSVRAAAVHALALRNQTDALDDLIPLLDDKKDAVSYRAAFTYLRHSNDGRRKPKATPPTEMVSKAGLPKPH